MFNIGDKVKIKESAICPELKDLRDKTFEVRGIAGGVLTKPIIYVDGKWVKAEAFEKVEPVTHKTHS